MDKDHLVELISSSLFQEKEILLSSKSYKATRDYLANLELHQLRIVSKEFIL